MMDITWQRSQPEDEPDGWISSSSGWLNQNPPVLAHPSAKYFPVTGSDGLPWILCPSEGTLRMINRQWAEATAFLIDRNVLRLGISLGTMPVDKVRAALTGVVAGAYHYTKKDRVSLTIQSAPEIDPVIVDDVMALALAQNWVRYLVDTPSNEKPPQTLRDVYQKDAKDTIHWQVIEAPELRAMGAGGILSVGQGSHRPPVLVAGKYEGNPGAPFLALVGKGVTFDSGGISLKPVESMGKMKADMAGSAAVMATLRLVAQQKWPVNVLAVSGLAENLPGGGAYRPGDIITMLDGTRAEIITTDAEGRLLLGDGVAYAVQQGASAIVDIATLTGANMVALGGVRASLIGNDSSWTRMIAAAGDNAAEPVWELPHDAEYVDLIRTRVADIKNSGGRAAGTITAAMFIGHFAKNVKWAHIDMAGMALLENATPIMRQGPTGFGVSLLLEITRLWISNGYDVKEPV